MIYFDNAATSYQKPRSVYESVVDTMVTNSINAGRGGYHGALRSSEILYETKELLSTLFHISHPENIAFSCNTTHALNMGIKGVLSYGEHVIISSMEHNSVLRPVKLLERQKRVSCSLLHANQKGEVDMNALKSLIRPNTKLICMTHSSNVCGTILDLYKAADIAHKHNILFMADVAQSAGAIDIDASKFDLMAFPGHKGLMGPMGTGGLYVRPGLSLQTIIEGGTGSLSESEYQPDMMPDRLESGTQNIPAIAGLGKAVEFLLEVGVKNIARHEESLCRYFEDKVSEIPEITLYGAQNKTAICALNIDGMDCVDVAQILSDKYNIAVRAGLHCAILAHRSLKTEKTGCVRFSFGYFNTKEEVDKAVDAIYDIVRNK